MSFQNSASPDLRRVVLHWTPARKNQANQQIAKRKIDALERRLLQKTGLFRSLLARHLNLKVRLFLNVLVSSMLTQ